MTMTKNEKSQIFNWNRYTDTLRHDLMLNGKSLLLKGLLMLAVTTTIMLIVTWPDEIYNHGISHLGIPNQAHNLFAVFKFCGMVFCCLGASLFMENMTTRGERLNSITLPASLLEKFAVRWTICIFGVTAAFFVAFTLGDLIRVFILRCYFPELEGFTVVGPWGVLPLSGTWYLPVTGLMTCQATYILGSTIWPKHSFLKTFGAMFAIGVVFSIIFSSVASFSLENLNYYNTSVEANDVELIMEKAWLIGTICWTAFCYIVAYMRAGESEIINRW